MKKTYINPEMEIVKVQTMQMLAASTELSNTEASVNGSGDYENALGHFDDNDW